MTLITYIMFGGLLLLDWAALDDITTGNEPNLTGEYAILAASVIIIFAVWMFPRFMKRYKLRR